MQRGVDDQTIVQRNFRHTIANSSILALAIGSHRRAPDINLQNRIFLSVGGPQHRLRPRKLAQSAAQSQCPRGGAGTRSQDQLKLRLEAAIELSFPFLV